ncbi:hypothetical protein HLB27_16710 [Dickeya dadantii]|nr:hypothetical protein [Dickeya dadantii]NPE60059.1 hypothetical protein [Dickeya dadantii]NPE72077.1 hypothetical protein [Dickeya dadantii]OOC11928.1 hypothetical protein BM451_19030 [Dickeya dadantii]UAY97412.1 hypothetical protein KTF62_05835 [Dickeya dadantii]
MSTLETQATSSSYAPARALQIESEGNAFGIELKKAQAEAYIPSRNETNVRSQLQLPAAAQELMEWPAMSPEERLFFSVLSSMGISKEQYEAMPPEQKMELDRKVQERIKEMAKEGRYPSALQA